MIVKGTYTSVWDGEIRVTSDVLIGRLNFWKLRKKSAASVFAQLSTLNT